MRRWLLTLLLVWPALAVAQDADVEDRARALGKQLRCVVCQNQSIEESDADLARDMRALVRERLAAGDSEAQVTAMMRDRYGDYVLLRPPVQRNTLLLWAGPGLLLLGAGGWLVLSRRRDMVAVEGLSDEERARLDALRGGR